MSPSYLRWLLEGYDLLDTVVHNSPWRDALFAEADKERMRQLRITTGSAKNGVTVTFPTPWHEQTPYKTYRRIEALFPTPSE